MSHKKKANIQVLSAFNLSFIQRDINILQKHYNVRTNLFDKLPKSPFNLIKTIWKIFSTVKKCDISYIWFVEWRAFLTALFSRLLNKKSVLIVGGYEVVKLPEIDYGGQLSWYNRLLFRWSIKLTDRVLAVSKSIKDDIFKHTGFAKAKVVYNGVDPDKFYAAGTKENIVITVGYVKNSNLTRKGLENFVKTAKYLPQIKFYLIGKVLDDSIDYLKSIANDNVNFEGYVTFDKLRSYYQKAKVYVQTSAHEGFGISLAEAMLSECVPVVTSHGALPEVVGNTGFYVEYNNPEETAASIEKALNSSSGSAARQRIENHFSLSNREEQLIKIIKNLL
ncbi:MAG: glycosyltransferase family 4 protein [Candidatus Cloacimonetes bacterium]|nr:glycosyltransferase family 4 protein [Candidatus Cloacimonadota bacterium]